MKIETHVARIMKAEIPTALKVLKLENLALRCFAGSWYQTMVREKALELKKTCLPEYAKMMNRCLPANP